MRAAQYCTAICKREVPLAAPLITSAGFEARLVENLEQEAPSKSEGAQVRALVADGAFGAEHNGGGRGMNRRTVARSEEPPRNRPAPVGSQLDPFEPVLGQVGLPKRFCPARAIAGSSRVQAHPRTRHKAICRNLRASVSALVMMSATV